MTTNDMEQWIKEKIGNIEIRDYQLAAWKRLQDARSVNRKRVLVNLATGLGKTSVAAVDVAYYLEEENPGSKVLFISHMNEISKQANNTFKFVNPNLTTDFFRYKLKDVDVTFATFQGLYNHLSTIDPNYFSYIIYDEAHHIEAETFSAVKKHFNADFVLGLTATPERADGRDIFNYFGHPIFRMGLADGINGGWLSSIDYHIVFDEAIKKAMDDNFELKSIKDIRELFAIRSRNEVISTEVLERRHDIGLDLAKTIVFCQNIVAAAEMAELLGGEVYHSDISEESRLDVMKRFKSGDLKVICTVDMFNEGIDIPDARLIVFLRSTSSRTIFEQQLGRGLRKFPGKDSVTVLDFVANVERINFVRDLGRHIYNGNSERRGSFGGDDGSTYEYEHVGESSLFDDSKESKSSITYSKFEFEDKVVEILDRYDKIQNIEHLKSEDVAKKYEELKNIPDVASYYKVAKSTIRKHLRKMNVEFQAKTISTDEVVAQFKILGKTSLVARHFGVSWQAIKKHLAKGGYDTSGHLAASKGIKDSDVIEVYLKFRSLTKTAKYFGVGNYVIKNKLDKNNVEIEKPNAKKYASPELIEAYHRLKSVRAVVEETGIGRSSVQNQLTNSGIILSPEKKKFIEESNFRNIYLVNKGDIRKIVEETGKSWTTVYKLLESYGYLHSVQKPITSAQAAAAYYKTGNSKKAGEILGISGTYVSRLSKGARYIQKYSA